ncbi:MAG: uracil-DNA glycosylase [Planctomycetota bacterium]|jgi:uracil-DNA glycosylase family 4|nr:uracil-DNA glycosylase [Planctomycetota bacterium]
MDDDRPVDLLRNLKQLLEADHWFGVESLPKPPESEQPAPAQRPGGVGAKRGADEAPAVASPAPSVKPHPVADIPSTVHGAEVLAAIVERISACERCGLCAKRTKVVPGEGAAQPDILFIGEGPGADEDRQGRPFVGAAGQLLDRMIVAMGYAREQVYIANVVKCRPPGNRAPEPGEVADCLPYLERQIEALQPKVICTLGNTPLRALSGNPQAGITRLRGKPFEYRGYTVIPTFHPSYLLRNDAGKKPCWEDLKAVLAFLGKEPPKRG